MKTLIYLGTHKGGSLSRMINQYDLIYGFEAIPEIYKSVNDRFKRYSHIKIFNYAVSDKNGEAEFNVSSNLVSSSLGSWEPKPYANFSMDKTIKVKTINLNDFLHENNIEEIDHYVSDLQGADLMVLKTIKEDFIDTKKIKSMFIETHADSFPTQYAGLENRHKFFEEILSDNYEIEKISADGRIVSRVTPDLSEYDLLWRLK